MTQQFPKANDDNLITGFPKMMLAPAAKSRVLDGVLAAYEAHGRKRVQLRLILASALSVLLIVGVFSFTSVGKRELQAFREGFSAPITKPAAPSSSVDDPFRTVLSGEKLKQYMNAHPQVQQTVDTLVKAQPLFKEMELRSAEFFKAYDARKEGIAYLWFHDRSREEGGMDARVHIEESGGRLLYMFISSVPIEGFNDVRKEEALTKAESFMKVIAGDDYKKLIARNSLIKNESSAAYQNAFTFLPVINDIPVYNRGAVIQENHDGLVIGYDIQNQLPAEQIVKDPETYHFATSESATQWYMDKVQEAAKNGQFLVSDDQTLWSNLLCEIRADTGTFNFIQVGPPVNGRKASPEEAEKLARSTLQKYPLVLTWVAPDNPNQKPYLAYRPSLGSATVQASDLQ